MYTENVCVCVCVYSVSEWQQQQKKEAKLFRHQSRIEMSLLYYLVSCIPKSLS